MSAFTFSHHCASRTSQNLLARQTLVWLCLLIGLSACQSLNDQPENTAFQSEVIQQAPAASPDTVKKANELYEVLQGLLWQQEQSHDSAAVFLTRQATVQQSVALAELAFLNANATGDTLLIKNALAAWQTLAPDDVEVAAASIQLAISEDQLNHAMDLWHQWLDQTPQTTSSPPKSLANELHRTLLTHGKQPQALDFFHRLLHEKNQDRPIAHQLGDAQDSTSARWSIIHQAAGYAVFLTDQSRALSFLAPVLTAPLNTQTALLLSQALAEIPDTTDADASSNTTNLTLQQIQHYRTLLLDYINRTPSDILVLHRLALFERAQQMNTLALEHFRRLQSRLQQPDQPTHSPQVTLSDRQRHKLAFSTRYHLSVIYLESGQNGLAVPHLRALIKVAQQPYYKNFALYFLGRIYRQEAQMEKAKTTLMQVTPGEFWAKAQQSLLQIFIEQRAHTQGFDYLSQIETQHKTRYPKLHLTLWFDQEGYRGATDYLQSIVEQEPNNLDIKHLLAQTHYQAQQWQQYEHTLKQIVQQDNQDVEALNALGYFYAEQNKHLAQAEAYINKANQLSPNQAHILDSLGWVNYKLERYDVAQQYLEQAFDMLPDPEIYRHLVALYQRSNQIQKLQTLRQQHPEFDALEATEKK